MNPIIKKSRVHLATDAPVPVRRRGHAKVVNLLRVDGEVRGIEFQCSCGEVTVLELEYGEAAAVPVTPNDAGASPAPTQEAA
jgi:hypothetical protein